MRLLATMSFFISSHLTAETAIIAHRGGMGHYPQGSYVGIKHCSQEGIDFLEYDLRLSADGVPIVYHDTTVNRYLCVYADGRSITDDYRVSNLTYAELQQFFCGGQGNKNHPQQIAVSERIHSLEEIINAIKSAYQDKGNSLPRLLLELKPVAEAEDLVQKVLLNLKKNGMSALTTIHSRNFLYGSIVRRVKKAKNIKLLEGVTPLPLQLVNRVFVRLLQRYNRTVVAFTANTPKQWKFLTKRGVDGIVTDYPVTLREFLAKSG